MYSTLISTDALNENFHKADWVVFDCRSSLIDHDAGLRAYTEGHIPNAFFCDLEKDLSSPISETSGRHPLPDFDLLIKKLEHWGVDNQTQVVVYDDMGGALAVRLWWQLRTFGHHKVAVLNGGIPQWLKEGKMLSQDIPKLADSAGLSFTAKVDKNAWLSTAQLEENLSTKAYTVLDARTPERYRGESEPIDTVAGRIPYSLNRAFQLNLDDSGLFLDTKTLHQQFELILKQVPAQSPENIVHLCGSGVTACHNMLAMEIAGLSASKLYAGSWSEWIRDRNRPIATS